MNGIFRTISTSKQMFQMIWKRHFGKKYIILKSLISLVNSLMPILYTILPGFVINELLCAQITRRLVIYILILVISPLLYSIFNSVIAHITFRCSQQINLQLVNDFEHHLMHMDYETLENPEIQDLKNRAEDVIGNLIGIVDQLYALIESAIIIISIASIVTLLNPIITIINVIIVLFNSILTKRQEERDYEHTKIIQSKIRKQYGISYNLHSMEYAKDIRLFNAGSFLLDKVVESQVDIDNDTRKMQFAKTRINLIQSVTSVISELVLYIYVVVKVVNHSLSIGNMTIFLASARQFASALSTLMRAYINLSNNTYKYDEYKRFITIPLHQYEVGNKKPVIDNNSVIEFRDVWFKYPGSDRYILKDFNIKIHLNQKLCVIGANGVGKTTFVKLLTRLYTPTKGQILLNGTTISEYNYDEYLSLFTAAFQDSRDFNLTIAENITLSSNHSTDHLNSVCASSDLSSLVKKLPKGYNTQVGKWIDSDGVNFSGGELQKLTIARAAYHDSHIYLLDEPTAALDPISEYNTYSMFDKMVKNRCAIFITHRLAAAKLTDRIAVFSDGHVVEYGTHKELYLQGGIYTEMFDKQAQFYRDNSIGSCGNTQIL